MKYEQIFDMVFNDDRLFDKMMGSYIDGFDYVIDVRNSDDIGFVINKIYKYDKYCNIQLNPNRIIIKNFVGDMVCAINSKYLDKEIDENKFEYELFNDNAIKKFSYVYIEFNDGNISEIVDGSWEREYSVISVMDFLNEYSEKMLV